jgi:hypothetical protein
LAIAVSKPIYQEHVPPTLPSTEGDPILEKPKSRWNLRRGKLVKHRRRVHPLAWILLGAILNMLVLSLVLWWVVGASPGKFNPPPAGASLAAADLSVRINQSYVNREISRAMKATPLDAFGVISVTHLMVGFEPGSQMKVTVKLNTLGRDFDFIFRDSLAVVNQKVVLTQIEDVKLQGLNIPLSALNEVVKQVNNLVENEINRQVGAGKPGDCLTCTNLGRMPTLRSLTSESGLLIAQFDIEIKD